MQWLGEPRIDAALDEANSALQRQIRKREAAYGWFLRWLMNRGDGGPFQEPPAHTAAVDDAEYLCFRNDLDAGSCVERHVLRAIRLQQPPLLPARADWS